MDGLRDWPEEYIAIGKSDFTLCLNPVSLKADNSAPGTVRFGDLIQVDHTPDMLNTVAETAYQQNILHLELMLSLDSNATYDLAKSLQGRDIKDLDGAYQLNRWEAHTFSS